MEELKVFYDLDIGIWRNMDYKYSTMDNKFCLNWFMRVKFPIWHKTIKIILFLKLLIMDIFMILGKHYQCSLLVQRGVILIYYPLAFRLQLWDCGVSK